MDYHFIRGRREANVEILYQRKTTAQEANSESQRSMPVFKGGSMALPSSFPDCKHPFSWVSSTPCMQISLAGVPHLWHLQHLGVSKEIQASPSSFSQWPFRASMQRLPSYVSVAFLSRKQLLSELFYPLIDSRTVSAPENILEFCLLVQSVVPEQACLYYFCSFNNSLTSCAWATVLVLLC